MEWVIGIGASVVSGLLLFCIKSLRDTERRIEERVSEMVAKEKVESILGHRRLNVLDQTLGDITEDKFDSRIVAQGQQRLPKIHPKIRKLLHGAGE